MAVRIATVQWLLVGAIGPLSPKVGELVGTKSIVLKLSDLCVRLVAIKRLQRTGLKALFTTLS